MISIVVLTYNRDVLPCLKSIKDNTFNKYELILVDNGDQYSNLYDKYVDKYIRLSGNEGVLSRNYGKLIAKYDYIACVDDDVTVESGWDQILLDAINSSETVGGAGPEGHFSFKDLRNYNEHRGIPGQYVDVLTGYCWMHRNIPEALMPWDYGVSSWHDETIIQFQMREIGYRFKMTPNVCVHNSQRGGTVNWEDHNGKIELIKERFNVKDLYLEKV